MPGVRYLDLVNAATELLLAACPPVPLCTAPAALHQASQAIHAVLSRYGPAERLGMDEVWVDVTQVRAWAAWRAADSERASMVVWAHTAAPWGGGAEGGVCMYGGHDKFRQEVNSLGLAINPLPLPLNVEPAGGARSVAQRVV